MMNIFGKSHTLELTPNNYLIPDTYVQQEVDENGDLHTLSSEAHQFYQGRLVDDPDSLVAIGFSERDIIVWELLE